MRIYLLLSCLVLIIQASASLSSSWAAYSGSLWRFFNLKTKNIFEGVNKVFIQQDMEDPSIEKNVAKGSISKKSEIPIIFENIDKNSIIQESEDTEENTNVRLDKLLDIIIKYREGKFVNRKRFVPLNVLLSNKLAS